MISHVGTGDLSSSIALAHHETGHVSRIGSQPALEFERPTFAAGALVWRPVRGVDPAEHRADDIEVLVVHRPRYDDWSLPKGKLDPGESLPQTAAREIAEETGLQTRLGWLLGYVKYPVKQRTKVVYYWTAQAAPDAALGEIDAEVDEMRWLPPSQAAELVSYDLDRSVILDGVDHVTRGVDRRVLLIRHAKAHPRQGWAGDDSLRPLAKKGRRQAAALVSVLQAYGVRSIVSAPPVRCSDSVAPAATALGLKVVVDDRLGDAAFVAGQVKPGAVVQQLAAAAGPDSVTAVVSQGLVIPAVLEELMDAEVLAIDDIRVKKASVWVLHFAGEQLVGADYLASPLPVK